MPQSIDRAVASSAWGSFIERRTRADFGEIGLLSCTIRQSSTAKHLTLDDMRKTPDYWIEQLRLAPHPEGGFYREAYRASEQIPQAGLPERFSGPRSFATSIYFLLGTRDFSAFHRIRSDETWHFYEGCALELHMLDASGHAMVLIGRDVHRGEFLQYTVPAGVWFASRPSQLDMPLEASEHYCLVGCTVSPGFDFNDFEMAERKQLLRDFSKHRSIIESLTQV